MKEQRVGESVQLFQTNQEERQCWGLNIVFSEAKALHLSGTPRHHQTTVCIIRNGWTREGAATHGGQGRWPYSQSPTSVWLSHGLPLCQAWHPWEMVLRITPPTAAAFVTITAIASTMTSETFYGKYFTHRSRYTCTLPSTSCFISKTNP